jgi:GntR family transcriptional regulator, transcriptional repressor for pyruvate dehydrogenase complex
MINDGGQDQGAIGRPAVRRPLSAVVAEAIQEHILTRGLAPGTPLPTEPELMEQFQVSRTVVREAARTLVQRGLVQVSPRHGMTVTAGALDALLDQLLIVLRTTRAGVDQLLEIRELIEPLIARLAASRRTEETLEELERALALGESAAGDAESHLQADIDFHGLLARATGNPFYVLFTVPTSALLRRTYSASADYLTHQQLSQAEHHRIFQAIKAGDGEGAERAARAHLERVRTSIKTLLAEPD